VAGNEIRYFALSPAGAKVNASENNEHNDEKTWKHNFYKQILAYMPNAEEVHLAGTGILKFKNTVTHESTTNKMSVENLVEFIDARFN
jgi:hypothetical protein